MTQVKLSSQPPWATSHGMLVQLPGATDTIHVLDSNEYGAALPHQCEQWIIGRGSASSTIGGLRQLITEAEAAIATIQNDQARRTG